MDPILEGLVIRLSVENKAQINGLWNFIGHLVNKSPVLNEITPENWQQVVQQHIDQMKEKEFLALGEKYPALAEFLFPENKSKDDGLDSGPNKLPE